MIENMPLPGYDSVIRKDMVNQRIVGKVLLRQINNLDIVQFFLDSDDLFGKIRRAIVQDMQDFHDISFYRTITLSASRCMKTLLS